MAGVLPEDPWLSGDCRCGILGAVKTHPLCSLLPSSFMGGVSIAPAGCVPRTFSAFHGSSSGIFTKD